MELKDALYQRRSVRDFTDKKIDDEILKEIVNAGLWAPSGVNLQPWYFVVVSSDGKKKELLSDMQLMSDKNRAHLEERFSAHPEVVESTCKFIAKLGGASAIILAFRDKPDYSYALQDEGIVQSIAAAVENMLLCAMDYGVYGCWMTAPAQAHMTGYMRDKFAPGHGELLCMIPLGYPKEVPNAPKRKDNKYEII